MINMYHVIHIYIFVDIPKSQRKWHHLLTLRLNEPPPLAIPSSVYTVHHKKRPNSLAGLKDRIV